MPEHNDESEMAPTPISGPVSFFADSQDDDNVPYDNGGMEVVVDSFNSEKTSLVGTGVVGMNASNTISPAGLGFDSGYTDRDGTETLDGPAQAKRDKKFWTKRRIWMACLIGLVVAIVAAIGGGVGVAEVERRSNPSNRSVEGIAIDPSSNTTGTSSSNSSTFTDIDGNVYKYAVSLSTQSNTPVTVTVFASSSIKLSLPLSESNVLLTGAGSKARLQLPCYRRPHSQMLSKAHRQVPPIAHQGSPYLRLRQPSIARLQT